MSKEKGDIEEKLWCHMNEKCEVESYKNKRFCAPNYFRVSFTVSLQALIASFSSTSTGTLSTSRTRTAKQCRQPCFWAEEDEGEGLESGDVEQLCGNVE